MIESADCCAHAPWLVNASKAKGRAAMGVMNPRMTKSSRGFERSQYRDSDDLIQMAKRGGGGSFWEVGDYVLSVMSGPGPRLSGLISLCKPRGVDASGSGS